MDSDLPLLTTGQLESPQSPRLNSANEDPHESFTTASWQARLRHLYEQTDLDSDTREEHALSMASLPALQYAASLDEPDDYTMDKLEELKREYEDALLAVGASSPSAIKASSKHKRPRSSPSSAILPREHTSEDEGDEQVWKEMLDLVESSAEQTLRGNPVDVLYRRKFGPDAVFKQVQQSSAGNRSSLAFSFTSVKTGSSKWSKSSSLWSNMSDHMEARRARPQDTTMTPPLPRNRLTTTSPSQALSRLLPRLRSSMGDSVSRTNELHPVLILSLDGGEVGSLATLEVLGRVLNTKLLDSSTPAQLFNFIVGSSSGALLAVMLGILGMSVEEAKTAYQRIMVKVFGCQTQQGSLREAIEFDEICCLGIGEEPRLAASRLARSQYRSAQLKASVTELLNSRHIGGRKLLGCGGKCRVALIATYADAASCPRVFRTYEGEHEDPYKAKVCEAVCASFATPGLFESVSINNIRYTDGSLSQNNNPAVLALNEVHDAFGQDREVGLLCSIGTGLSWPVSAHVDTEEDLKAFGAENLRTILSETSKAEQTVSAHCKRAKIRYHRFDPPFYQSLSPEDLKELDVRNRKLLGRTSSWLARQPRREGKDEHYGPANQAAAQPETSGVSPISRCDK